jgi:serine/threonine protein kinase
VGTVCALVLLHASDTVMETIKLKNVLVFKNPQHGFKAKLAHFGFCCPENLGERRFKGTRLFNGPRIRILSGRLLTEEKIV